ncbi:MAG: hypothetical protein ABI282_10955 [Candidatus Baltobacteraceae bacterium]
MLPPLRDSDRRRLVFLSIALSCSSVALLPLSAQSSSSGASDRGPIVAASIPDVPSALRFPEVVVSRDPFVPAAGAQSVKPVVDTLVPDGIVLPPNSGADGIPGGENTAPVPRAIVRAIVLGPQSRALVEMGSAVKILEVGDSIGSAVISSIDANGINLSTGLHIPLTEPR